MGCWGHHSWDSDGCWNALRAEDIHKMSQPEADASLENAWVKGEHDYEPEDKVGVVGWILRQGLQVHQKFLDMAYEWAPVLAKDDYHLNQYSDPPKRLECLEKEVRMIAWALDHNGRWSKDMEKEAPPSAKGKKETSLLRRVVRHIPSGKFVEGRQIDDVLTHELSCHISEAEVHVRTRITVDPWEAVRVGWDDSTHPKPKPSDFEWVPVEIVWKWQE